MLGSPNRKPSRNRIICYSFSVMHSELFLSLVKISLASNLSELVCVPTVDKIIFTWVCLVLHGNVFSTPLQLYITSLRNLYTDFIQSRSSQKSWLGLCIFLAAKVHHLPPRGSTPTRQKAPLLCASPRVKLQQGIKEEKTGRSPIMCCFWSQGYFGFRHSPS